ncbi:MAG: hypothetical protein ACF8R7_17500 [Phycisphaerales bacterium JB039]
MRRLRNIPLYLVIGAIATGAVGVLAGLWAPATPLQRRLEPSHRAAQSIVRQLGATPDNWGPPSSVGFAHGFGATQWLVFGPLRGEASGEYLGHIIRFGWPARCLEATPLWDSSRGTIQQSAWRAGIVTSGALRPWARKSPRYYNILPIRPIIAGWIINIAFYAALLWLAFPGRRLAVGLWRRGRGRCPRCGYPLAGGLCPECGAGAPAESPACGGARSVRPDAAGATSCPS